MKRRGGVQCLGGWGQCDGSAGRVDGKPGGWVGALVQWRGLRRRVVQAGAGECRESGSER
jgi:hypothetical protein